MVTELIPASCPLMSTCTSIVCAPSPYTKQIIVKSMFKMYKPSNVFPEYIHGNLQQNNVRPNLATHKKGHNRIIIVTIIILFLSYYYSSIVLSLNDKVGLRSTAALHFVIEQRNPRVNLTDTRIAFDKIQQPLYRKNTKQISDSWK